MAQDDYGVQETRTAEPRDFGRNVGHNLLGELPYAPARPPSFHGSARALCSRGSGGLSATRAPRDATSRRTRPQGEGGPLKTEHTHGACGGLSRPRGPPGQNPSDPRVHTKTSLPFHGPLLCPFLDVPPHAQAWMSYPLHRTGDEGRGMRESVYRKSGVGGAGNKRQVRREASRRPPVLRGVAVGQRSHNNLHIYTGLAEVPRPRRSVVSTIRGPENRLCRG